MLQHLISPWFGAAVIWSLYKVNLSIPHALWYNPNTSIVIFDENLFSFLHPALNSLPRLAYHIAHTLLADFGVHLGKAPALLHALADALVGVRHHGEALLVRPRQVGHVAHRDGHHGPACAHAERQGHGGPEEDVAPPRDDAARHGRDQHVDHARHQLLAGLARRRQRCDGVGERLLEVEGLVHRVVDGVLGRARLPVQEQARLADLHGQSVGRCRPARHLAFHAGR